LKLLALPANLASLKVLEKCGMKYLHEEMMHVIFTKLIR
jgi:RimJ/RimL family protein N-acetyltransferase